MNGISQALIATTARAIAHDKLAAFGAAVLRLHRSDAGCDLDGGDVQELAEKAGVLEQRTVTEPCGESCVCAEVGALPGRCFFVPDEVAAIVCKD